jgi:hypothetical protein
LLRLGVRVFERFLSGLDRERTQVAIRKCSEGGFADADYGDWSHIFSG